MKKRNKIIYWFFTLWMSLGMVSTGIVQLLKSDGEVQNMTSLGFPLYLLTFIGVLKIAGVIVALAPALPVLKEWTYAGFIFLMSGALYSHIISGHGPAQVFPPSLLLTLTFISWYFRPENRRVMSLKAAVPQTS